MVTFTYAHQAEILRRIARGVQAEALLERDLERALDALEVELAIDDLDPDRIGDLRIDYARSINTPTMIRLVR